MKEIWLRIQGSINKNIANAKSNFMFAKAEKETIETDVKNTLDIVDQSKFSPAGKSINAPEKLIDQAKKTRSNSKPN